jgi:hypothetical protein
MVYEMPKSNKVYICESCETVIQAKSRYFRIYWGGGAISKICSKCFERDLAKEVKKEMRYKCKQFDHFVMHNKTL